MLGGAAIGPLGRLFESGTVTGLGEAQLLERFLDHGDTDAFEAILRRHGPMVLGVCRRVLRDPHDVDDAFQATFLVLVSRGRSIRDRESLATWLHGVSRRVAVRARVNARRRSDRERPMPVEPALAEIPDPIEAQERRSAIDDELARLPARYREVVILCDLDGRTHEQAAAVLGCPVGTIKSRLARGRDRLRAGLVRRGVEPTNLVGEAIPAMLLKATLGAAGRVAAGRSIAAGASSAGAASLAKGVMRSLFLVRSIMASGALALAVLATSGVGALVERREAPAASKAQAPPPAPDRPKEREPAPGDRGVERFRLANGLRVILRPIQEAKEAALVVVFEIGGDHDPRGRSGLAHTIEHLYLTSAAGIEPSRTVENLRRRYPTGWNGQTGDRYTVIATVFPGDRLDRELADAAARMQGPNMKADDLDRERPRLIREVTNMFEGFPPLAALNVARERARPTPSGGRHGGRPEHLQAITVDEVQARLARYYKPRNAFLSIAGGFDPIAARRVIEARFSSIPSGEPVPAPPEIPAPSYLLPTEPSPRKEAQRGPDDIPEACLAYRAPAPDSEFYPAFLVLVARLWLLGGPFGGVGATGSPVYFTPIDDGSVVAISGALRAGEPPAKTLGQIEQRLARILGPKLAPFELNRTKQQFGMPFGLADLPDALLARNPYGLAFALARRDQLGLDPVRINRALDRLTDQDLKRAAAAIFDPARHAGAIEGVIEDRH